MIKILNVEVGDLPSDQARKMCKHLKSVLDGFESEEYKDFIICPTRNGVGQVTAGDSETLWLSLSESILNMSDEDLGKFIKDTVNERLEDERD